MATYSITTSQKKAFANYVLQSNPDLFKTSIPFIQKPEPIFIAFNRMHDLLRRFCEYKGLDEKDITGMGRLRNEKQLFIGAIIKLYDPEVITGLHRENVMPRLRSELTDVLKWNEECVSQVVNTVKDMLNEMKREKHHGLYEAFSKEVEQVCTYLTEDNRGPESSVINMFKTEAV